ncbi:alpha/beta hydrolase [Sabulicella glaciei]|uniref:Alpha/beta hydrolase n=1 Tax=Sabulicella glaciei TaxID=2984948 RepID=A0ABT3P0J9_9PROT|nr:alpha/beta hydrolase [Roseococcus sp. MDT2-1-1]MCW8087921.1 alpha/beta hydrolase [Roseococcus sp. MDT2-1-1]
MATNTAEMPPLDEAVLPPGIRSRFVSGVNGMQMHVLEAGHEAKDRPCVLLLHGFPEIAYSWRTVMPALAEAGFHVVAPDQRGYGRTTGWDPEYDGDLRSFRLLNLVGDALALLSALGVRSVHAVVGHDFGASVAAWSALVRPDVFRSVALMSAPFAGPPSLPFGTADAPPQAAKAGPDIHEALARLPRPRKHYQWHYSTRAANAEMWRPPEGVHAFLRAYFHNKSADWAENQPKPLAGWTAEELAKLPTYYVMDLDRGMAETVAPHMPGAADVAACRWLPEAELSVYSTEYARTGFQGGLQWYRCRTEGVNEPDLRVFSGRTIDVPSVFIAGAQDWGIHQTPGALDAMQSRACTQMLGCHLIEGAGHWVQQEQPEAVTDRLLEFLRRG